MDGEIADVLEGRKGVDLVMPEVWGWRGGLCLRWGRQLGWEWRWLDGRSPLQTCFLRRNSGGGCVAAPGALLMPWRVAGGEDDCWTSPAGWVGVGGGVL